MKSNGYVTYLDGWGMSIATQRAKEPENRTPDVKVMSEMVEDCWLKSEGSHVRGEPGFPGLAAQKPARFLHCRSRMYDPMVWMSDLWPECPV